MFGIKLYDGRVEILMSHLEADGSTIFKVNGRICRYWGSALPFKNGDRVVLGGHWHPSGVLLVRAICLPQTGLFFSWPAWSQISDGAGVIATGVFLFVIATGDAPLQTSKDLLYEAIRALPGFAFFTWGALGALDGWITHLARSKVKARLTATGFYRPRKPVR